MSVTGARRYGRWGDRRRYRWFVRGLHLDLPLVSGLVLLAITGLVILYSASGQNTDIITRQLLHLSLAFFVMVALAQIPPHHIAFWAPWLYGAGLVLLAAVLFMGEVGKGAQRWLDLGVLRFQPSEIMKIAVPMMIAWYLADKRLPPSPSQLAAASLMMIIPVALVVRQPDLGTALLIAGSGCFVFILAGIRWRLVLGVTLIAAACMPLMWYFMHDYQRNRVLTFFNPESDPLGAGYHIIQSKIAIGSGGLFGKGWLNGTQSHLDFLPERSTDFIFAVLGEEFGLIGALLVLAVYVFILVRGLYIATQAQDTFTRLLAGGLILTFFIYVLVNVGMVTGLLPVVGLPLPLISYGGTSMVTLMAAFGILNSIHTHRKLMPS